MTQFDSLLAAFSQGPHGQPKPTAAPQGDSGALFAQIWSAQGEPAVAPQAPVFPMNLQPSPEESLPVDVHETAENADPEAANQLALRETPNSPTPQSGDVHTVAVQNDDPTDPHTSAVNSAKVSTEVSSPDVTVLNARDLAPEIVGYQAARSDTLDRREGPASGQNVAPAQSRSTSLDRGTLTGKESVSGPRDSSKSELVSPRANEGQTSPPDKTNSPSKSVLMRDTQNQSASLQTAQSMPGRPSPDQNAPTAGSRHVGIFGDITAAEPHSDAAFPRKVSNTPPNAQTGQLEQEASRSAALQLGSDGSLQTGPAPTKTESTPTNMDRQQPNETIRQTSAPPPLSNSTLLPQPNQAQRSAPLIYPQATKTLGEPPTSAPQAMSNGQSPIAALPALEQPHVSPRATSIRDRSDPQRPLRQTMPTPPSVNGATVTNAVPVPILAPSVATVPQAANGQSDLSLEPEVVLAPASQTQTAQHATPAAAINRAYAPQVAQQITAAIVQTSGRSTEIMLNPEELGRVRIAMTAGDAGMTVTLLAERPETTELMRRNIEHLSRELRDMGYENPTFNFENQSGDSSENKGQDAPNYDTALDLPPPEASPITRQHVALSGGLDLKL